MRILLVEDDPDLSRQLKLALGDAGYAVDHAADGEEAQFLGETEPYDAVVLDLGLPKVDGVSVLERWRRGNVATPVLILTARGSWNEKVAGFDAGADDYLTKPFSTHELMARIRAVLRRKAPEALDTAVEVGPLKLDPATRRVSREGQEVRVGPTEFRLLHFFMTHPERVHSRSQLLDRVWGDHVFIEERTVDVHVKRLREALNPVSCSQMIETVRGAGYRLTQQVQSQPMSA